MSCSLSSEQLEIVRTNPGKCPHLAALAESRKSYFNAMERLSNLEAPRPGTLPPVQDFEAKLAAARNAVRSATYLYEQAQDTAREARPDVFAEPAAK